MTLLLLCLLSAAFMAGLSWLISVVHYPLFARVGAEAFPAYHDAHTRLITPVVLPPMATELVTSSLLVVDRPDGVGSAVVIAGFVLAAGTWAATGLLAVPEHGRLSERWDAQVHRRLVLANHVRTALWSAHAALLCCAVVAAS